MQKKYKKNHKIQKYGNIFLLYMSLKQHFESNGIDSATASQKAWLFASCLFSIFFGIIAIFVWLIGFYDSYNMKPDDILIKYLTFCITSHFFFIMLRIKYFVLHALFSGSIYLCYIVAKLQEFYMLFSIGLLLALLYIALPLYSRRVKILDSIIYFIYGIYAWYLL